MRLSNIVFVSFFLVTPASGQIKPEALTSPYQQQRNMAMDAWGQCLASQSDLQAQIATLQKELDKLKTEKPDK